MQTSTKVLIIDDDESERYVMELLLRKAGFDVRGAADGLQGRKLIGTGKFDLALVDLFLPDCNGIDLLKDIRQQAPETEVVMITGHASAESAVMAMKLGAFDYITKPVNFEELKIVLEKAREKQRLLSENVYLRKQLSERFRFENIIGNSPAMQRVFERMQRIILTDSTVLISGESGTGKELVASAIHHNSKRKDKPFVAVNCGAIPETLLESELFGHVRGAFTGAVKDRLGKFESAHRGTIFLDEIGTMPLHLQSKMLRVLQEQEVERVGSSTKIKLDVRVISASNADLAELVRQGLFREDLYYRLNVIPLHLPPLRERKEDILPLVSHFIGKFGHLMGRGAVTLSKQALDALEKYLWPGNVRQLENVVERMIALSDDDRITIDDLPSEITEKVEPRFGICLDLTPDGINMPLAIEELERGLILRALDMMGGVKARAAMLLGINRTTLVEKMKRMGV